MRGNMVASSLTETIYLCNEDKEQARKKILTSAFASD
jgi:hypothetical protein